MLLKIIIVILLVGLLISLTSALVFLFKDVGSTKRTMHSLGVRITLAVALMATTVYGFLSGQLKIGAPWDSRKFGQAVIAEPAPEQNRQIAPETITPNKDEEPKSPTSVQEKGPQ